MSIQVARLRSGEDVIADIKEIRNTLKDPVAYLFRQPRVLTLIKESEAILLSEATEPTGDPNAVRVAFSSYMPLSKDTESLIPFDWVVTIGNPLDEVLEMYEENLNGTTTDRS
jgi:hypothetical protein